MGGNVFKNTIRLTSKQYKTLSEIIEYYLAISSIGRFNIIKAYRKKESFGDMDILISKSCITEDHVFGILNLAAKKLGYSMEDNAEVNHKDGVYTKYVKNGDITSYAMKTSNDPDDKEVFQIDVIRVDEGAFNFACNYFSYNDLGNFIGRIAHKFGLKFGHNGLWYPLHWKELNGADVFLGDILLTDSFKIALEYLGFRGELFLRYWDGFDTMEDVYQFVYDNPYVYNDMFDLKEVSHVARIRDRKRSSYSGLLKWMESVPKKENKFVKDKSFYLQSIASEFPHFEEEFKRRIADHLLKRELKSRWNGNMAKDIDSTLTGKDLGVFLNTYRPSDLILLKKENKDIAEYMKASINEYNS